MYLSASTFVSVFHPNLISLSGRSYFLGNTEATFSPVFFTLHSVFKISVVVKQEKKQLNCQKITLLELSQWSMIFSLKETLLAWYQPMVLFWHFTLHKAKTFTLYGILLNISDRNIMFYHLDLNFSFIPSSRPN